MKGAGWPRLAAAGMTLMVILSVGAGVASAQTAAPYFSALPASGASELQTGRSGAVTSTLPNGQVLIAGGENKSDILQSAELFNPAGDTFTVLPASGSTELQTPRSGAAAAALPNGQVLIAGGYNNDSGYLQSAELFHPATDTFTMLPASGSTELQTPRAAAAAAALPDGHVLIAGGYNGNSDSLQSAELFNPATDTFSVLPASGSTELQTPRYGAAAAALPNGQVLMAGGVSRAGTLQSAELYNSAPEAAVAGGDFGDQTVGQSSALHSLVLTNIGAQALTLSGARLGGVGRPGDFAIISDTCVGRTLTFAQRCTITARFTPSTAGLESATIELSDNEPIPTTIALSGTGLAPNRGTPGIAASTQAPGTVGSQGSQGKHAQIDLVTCWVVTKRVKLHGKKHAVTKQECTTQLISGTGLFSPTIAKATLTRHGVIYATGTARPTRLLLHARSRLRAGKYTLSLIRQVGHRRLESHQQITID